MRSHLLLGAALTALGFCLVVRADAPKPGPATLGDRDSQDFVYLGEKGPVLIRFHVRIDGKPLQDVWEEYIGKIFAYVDLDGDGVLSKDEAERLPSVQVLFSNGLGARGSARPAVPGVGTNKDGKVTKAELANWYRRSGLAPFQFRPGGQTAGQALQFVYAGQSQPLSADALNEKLFSLLDANKDGKLSREELARAPAILQKLDADDDEMISVDEVSGNAPSGTTKDFIVAAAYGAVNVPDNLPFVMVGPNQPSKNLVRQLQQRYGPKGRKPDAKKLTRKDLGLDEATFAQLDADKDGVLDGEELARFAQRPPDLEFLVRLGKKGGKEAAVEMISPKDPPAPFAKSVRTGSGGALLLEFGNTQIELGNGGSTSDTRVVGLVRQQFLNQFRMADKDNNGYLDKKEAEQNPLFRNQFKMMDRDGDGKLYDKEVIAYLDKMQEFQDAAMQSCASLSVKDRGRGLFDLVDASGDGRLSVRELRQMVKLVDQLDRDANGQISRGEIPHKYRADVQKGPANGNQFLPRAVVIRRLGTTTPDLPPLAAGPSWFRKMDRNHDGDVSRREFLGTEEEFRRIDTDGDGLISLAEAERADKLFRKDKADKP